MKRQRGRQQTRRLRDPRLFSCPRGVNNRTERRRLPASLPFPARQPVIFGGSSTVSVLGLSARRREMATATATAARCGAAARLGDRAWAEATATARRARYLRSRPRRKMSPATSLGSSVDSHNPQRAQLPQRASAARGAEQLLERRARRLRVSLLTRRSLTLCSAAPHH